MRLRRIRGAGTLRSGHEGKPHVRRSILLVTVALALALLVPTIPALAQAGDAGRGDPLPAISPDHCHYRTPGWTLNFGSGSSVPRGGSQPALARILSVWRVARGPVLIEAHIDEEESRIAGTRLDAERAGHVRQFLLENGVPEEAIWIRTWERVAQACAP
jgi:hypothetical protein